MITKEEVIEKLKELGRNFKRYYAAGEWHKADQQYQKFILIAGILELTEPELQEVYKLFPMWETDRALEKAGLRAVSQDPYGIRKRA